MADHTLNITGVTDISLIKKWQKRAAKRMWEFTKRGFPLRSRLTGRELYIDTSVTGTLSLSGTVPHAGQSKRFRAPVDERVPSPPIRVKLPIGWRTVYSARASRPSCGVRVRPMTYDDGRSTSEFVGFFGLKGKAKTPSIRAYGLTADDKAYPVFNDLSAVEWLSGEQRREMLAILEETFSETFQETFSGM